MSIMKNNAVIGILNRGEAALRFIRAVKEYNSQYGTQLQTVAFYIDKEEYAPFAKQADKGLALSSLSTFPGKQKSPYLDHDVMLEALSSSGCTAVWVGWGFVSEDAPFTEKVEKAGLVFLGPSSKAMAILGDKIQAKDLADTADVPILPWSKKSVDTLKEAKKVSLEIGYPVIVKAANAGGGRGIRFVRTPEELEKQYKSAQEETVRITGNSIVFIEYLVEQGRHLEVQVLADTHGNVNTFGARDCSVQRKNQKIIEETPPPKMDPVLIKEMEEAASRLIRAAKYVGAGTVEYLFDLKSNRFFFMEVNTRLQVEHPITETLYGIDLVKGQIDVARGIKVDWSEKTPRGAVIEVRLNAEDPDREFSPAPGLVNLFKAPAGPGIRVDSGIEEGSEIPPEFDSMIAKIIAQGDDRNEAISRLLRALSEMRIRIKDGTTNRSFLMELLQNPSIIAGGIHTGFVEELLKTRKRVLDDALIEQALIAGAIEIYLQQKKQDFLNFRQQLAKSGRPRSNPKAKGVEVNLSTGGCAYTFDVREQARCQYIIDIEEQQISCQYIRTGKEATLFLNEERHNILMVPRGDILQCEINGIPVCLESDSGGCISAPSPAIVLSIPAKPGQAIKKGDVLLILEAMKMEMLVDSPYDGIVTDILVDEGAQVFAGQPLVQLEAAEEKEEVIEEKFDPVSFQGFSESKHPELDWINSLHALFLGFDSNGKETAALSRLIASNPANLALTLIRLLEEYNGVENLFTPTEMEEASLARPMTYPEMLSHYFRRIDDREKGLPQGFLNDLDKAFSLYPEGKCTEGDEQDEALFHIFRSHSSDSNKQDVLKLLLSELQKIPIPELLQKQTSNALNTLIRISRFSNISLADGAINARYQLVDKPRRDEYDRHLQEDVKTLVEKISQQKPSREDLSQISNSGSGVLKELVRRLVASQGESEERILNLIGHKMNRDRQIKESKTLKIGDKAFGLVKSRKEDKTFTTILGVWNNDIGNLPPLKSIQKQQTKGSTLELQLLIQVETLDKADEIFNTTLKTEGAEGVTLTVGIYCGIQSEFRSYSFNGKWKENNLHRGFNPRQYRELRVYRLINFKLKTLYRSENVFLLEATAKENPKDIRLISLVDISEAGLKINHTEDQGRLIFLESRLMEAILAMRTAQTSYKYRLVWNRIIVHNRALLEMSVKDLQNYGEHLLPLTADLGIEKMIIYSVRKRWSEEQVQEIALNFTIVADNRFELRYKIPSNAPLESYNNYVSRAVVARQRNNIYPYEFIKILTAETGLDAHVSAGNFEEYDIEITKEGIQTLLSCKDRTPGKNQSNIVFGIITNNVDYMKEPLKRVIILSDPTKDLGSLSEPECRRVNAALDLAEKQQLPVEWISISSGAKITMDSGTENLDWTATTLRRIINFTQAGGEINIIVPGINVGAQSYWNAEATMLMHTRGLLIMTDDGAMLLTGKKALDFSGSVSGETNLDVGGAEKIMAPNGQAQVRVAHLSAAYQYLYEHYRYTYVPAGSSYPPRKKSRDSINRDISKESYNDFLAQGFETIGDIFSLEKNPERKKPFDIRQVMQSLVDNDSSYCERWRSMQDSDTAIVWETQMGGYSVGMIGIESRNLSRIGEVPFDGPESWSGGTLFPQSSKKVARGINSFSGHLPLVIVANLSGFDGSPESLRRLQLEYGAEIGRAIVNFKGPISFVVVARYHGGAYVVFSKSLNPNLRSAALEGSFASVIGGAPAAAVIFPKQVLHETNQDKRILEARSKLQDGTISDQEFDTLFKKVKNEKQTERGQSFDQVHSVKRAQTVGSIDDLITPSEMRKYIIDVVEKGIQ